MACAGLSVASDTPAAVQPAASGFDATVHPFIETYCVECHSGRFPEAELDLGSATLASVTKDPVRWHLTTSSGESEHEGVLEGGAALLDWTLADVPDEAESYTLRYAATFMGKRYEGAEQLVVWPADIQVKATIRNDDRAAEGPPRFKFRARQGPTLIGRGLLTDPEGKGEAWVPVGQAARVMICRGRRSRRTSSTSCRPAASVESAFSASSAAIVEVIGKLMPIASMADDIVFAVYMPPHEPTPGQALRSMPSKSVRDMRPAAEAPTASKTLTMVRSSPPQRPALMVPP
jgi:hypothetical protein